MKQQVLLDTGVLIAYLKSQDNFYAWAVSQWQLIEPPFLTCEAVIRLLAELLEFPTLREASYIPTLLPQREKG